MKIDNRRGPKREERARLNEQIRAAEVRVIDDEGEMLGVMSPAEALKMAEAKGLDLVEVAPTAKPPTCKIMDFGKYLYEQKKKAQESKKKQVQISVKEIQLRPRTDTHDINVKLRSARKFILQGDKVRINMRFRGREMAHQELGMKLIQQVIKEMEDLVLIEVMPKMEGQQLFTLLAPDAVKVKLYKKNNPEKEKETSAKEASAKS